MEQNTFIVGVRFVFPTNSDHQIERALIASVKVILNGMVKVKGETVARLISVGESHGGRSVRPTTVGPLNAVGRHAVPSDFILNPQSRFFHSVDRNDGIAGVGLAGQFQFCVDDGEIVMETQLVQRSAKMDQSLFVRSHA